MYVCGRDLAWGGDELLYEQLSGDYYRSPDYFDDYDYRRAYDHHDNYHDNCGTFGAMLLVGSRGTGKLRSIYKGSVRCRSGAMG